MSVFELRRWRGRRPHRLGSGGLLGLGLLLVVVVASWSGVRDRTRGVVGMVGVG